MFNIYRWILIQHFLLAIVQAIQWVRVGHLHDDDLLKAEIYHTSAPSGEMYETLVLRLRKSS